MGTRLPVKRGGRRSYATFTVMNMGKGLNNLISDNLIDDREASDLENIQFVESGAPSKAMGFVELGTGLSTAPRGMGFYQDTSFNKYLLTVDGTALKYLNGTTWTSISGATFNASNQINFTQAAGKMFILDKDSGAAQLSGLTLTRPTTTPKGSFSIYYGGYHIMSGVPTKENRLYISTSTDPSDFTNLSGELSTSAGVPAASTFAGTGANYIDVNPDDGDKITGLAKFNEVLIIFKERSIYQLTFDSTGVPVLQAVSKTYGCVSHRSVDNVENDVFFLTRNGVYVLGNEANYFNVIRTNELSARIHPIIETINVAQFDKSSALFNQYVYYLGIPSGGTTTNNVTLTYDRRYQSWSKWTHVAPESMCLYLDSSNNEKVAFTSTTEAKVYVLTPSTYSANGEAISAQWTSKAFDLNDFPTYKRWIDITILFRQLVGRVNITIYTDNGTIAKETTISNLTNGGLGSEMFGDVFFGGNVSTSGTSTSNATNNVPYRIRISTKARSLKVKISNDRENENFVVLGMALTYRKYSHFVFDSSLKI